MVLSTKEKLPQIHQTLLPCPPEKIIWTVGRKAATELGVTLLTQTHFCFSSSCAYFQSTNKVKEQQKKNLRLQTKVKINLKIR